MAVLDVTSDEFVERLIALVPPNWFSVEAKAPGGNLYALLKSMAENSRTIMAQLILTQSQLTFTTATGAGLDSLAETYFGNKLPRKVGETDAAYRARCVSRLFLPVGTREGMNSGLIRALNPYTILTSEAKPGDTVLDVISTEGMSEGQQVQLQDGNFTTSTTISSIISGIQVGVAAVQMGHKYPAGSTVIVGMAPMILEPNDTFSTGGWSDGTIIYGPLALNQGGMFSGGQSQAYECLITVQQPEVDTPHFMYYEDIMDLVTTLKPIGVTCWVRVLGPAKNADGSDNASGKPIARGTGLWPGAQ